VALAIIGYVTLGRNKPIDAWLTVTLALITGGILGNLYDRLGLWHAADTPLEVRYGVRDWILFKCRYIPLRIFNPWPNFNIADCLLVVGACSLALYSLWNPAEPATAASPPPAKSRG
jgi:signal peptidase II